MLMKIDDYIARAFFTKNIVIVEGDTEDILIRETLSRLPKEDFLKLVSSFEVIKARLQEFTGISTPKMKFDIAQRTLLIDGHKRFMLITIKLCDCAKPAQRFEQLK